MLFVLKHKHADKLINNIKKKPSLLNRLAKTCLKAPVYLYLYCYKLLKKRKYTSCMKGVLNSKYSVGNE